MSLSLLLPELSPHTAPQGGFAMPEYTQELAFDTDDPEFVRGFEAARVGAQLHNTDDQVEATVHNTNAEMMLRLAELTHRHVHCQELDDTWMTVTFAPYEETR